MLAAFRHPPRVFLLSLYVAFLRTGTYRRPTRCDVPAGARQHGVSSSLVMSPLEVGMTRISAPDYRRHASTVFMMSEGMSSLASPVFMSSRRVGVKKVWASVNISPPLRRHKIFPDFTIYAAIPSPSSRPVRRLTRQSLFLYAPLSSRHYSKFQYHGGSRRSAKYRQEACCHNSSVDAVLLRRIKTVNLFHTRYDFLSDTEA